MAANTTTALPTQEELNLVWSRLADVDDAATCPPDGPHTGPFEIHRAICAAVADEIPVEEGDVARIATWIYEMREVLGFLSRKLDEIEEATMVELSRLARGLELDEPIFDRNGDRRRLNGGWDGC